MQDQTEQIEWRAGDVPVSTRFDDPFFSLEDGMAETAHVFLDGNDLPRRFAPGFHIAELGFGTGLNLLMAWQAWRESGQQTALRFTSFEAFPITQAQMRRAHQAFPALEPLGDALAAAWPPSDGQIALPGLELHIVFGDARQTLPAWGGQADAWFLDGFSPAKNPELWAPELLAAVARHTAPGGTAATYTAAGAVRRALSDAGFAVTRTPGFGRKRHMTRAALPA